jgi:exopolysaccharide biosynthesis polyprenyl glycosylphosphotransferase
MKNHLSSKKLLLLLGDVLLIITSFYLSYAIRQKEYIDVFVNYTWASVWSIVIFLFTFYIADIYNLKDKFGSTNFLFRLAIAVLVATGLIAATFYVFSLWHYSRLVFILNGAFIFSLLFLWRLIFSRFDKSRKYTSRVLIVGAGRTGKGLYNTLQKNDNYEIVGFLDDDEKKRGMTIGSSKVIGDTGLLQSLVNDKDIDEVVVAINKTKLPALFKRILDIKFMGVEINDMPRFYEKVSAKIPILYLRDSWFGYVNIYGLKKNLYNKKIKKILDRLVAILVIVGTLPFTIMAILAIKLDSKGPIFFRQERVGENVKIFTVTKFRTMIFGREDERHLAGSENDPRITRVGKMLRFFRIDEIPQLWNVIKGDMSIVGPRSLIKEEVDKFMEIPYFHLRHSVKPGITGWAQVNYKHGTDINDATEKIQYDLFYIKNLSPSLDFHIILMTIRVMLFGKGAR